MSGKAHNSALVPAFCIVILAIIYGSSFPFQFDISLASDSLEYFLASWKKINSIGDLLGNLVLFAPYGYMGCLLADRTGQRTRSALVIVLSGLLLAMACQLIQMITPGRDPSFFDLYTNAMGGALGWYTARLVPLGSAAKIRGVSPAQQLVMVFALLLPVSQLLPLIPSIDLQLWKDSLKPLLLYPRFLWQECLWSAVAWFTFLHLLSWRAGLRFSITGVVIASLLLLGLKVIIVQNYLNFSMTCGLLLALLAWATPLRRCSGEAVGLTLLGAFAVNVLAPLVVHDIPRNFGWLPFEGYLQGSMLINSVALTRKSFVFGALAVLLVDSRPSAGSRVVLIALILLFLEIMQRSIGHGTPTLTDPLLFLGLAWFVQRQMAKYRNS